MADKVYIVGAYVASDDPALRRRAFIPLTSEYQTLAEAVAAVEQDYRSGHGGEPGVTFVAYTSASGGAVVEVSRGGPFDAVGFYKVAQVEAVES